MLQFSDLRNDSTLFRETFVHNLLHHLRMGLVVAIAHRSVVLWSEKRIRARLSGVA